MQKIGIFKAIKNATLNGGLRSVQWGNSMKKISVLFIGIALCMWPVMTRAGYSLSGGCSSPNYACPAMNCRQMGVNSSYGCSGYSTVYFGNASSGFAYGYCEGCSAGYVAESNVRTVPGTSCTITFDSCTTCPTASGVSGSIVSGGNKITDCYISNGASFSDASGSGKYVGNCYWRS